MEIRSCHSPAYHRNPKLRKSFIFSQLTTWFRHDSKETSMPSPIAMFPIVSLPLMHKNKITLNLHTLISFCNMMRPLLCIIQSTKSKSKYYWNTCSIVLSDLFFMYVFFSTSQMLIPIFKLRLLKPLILHNMFNICLVISTAPQTLQTHFISWSKVFFHHPRLFFYPHTHFFTIWIFCQRFCVVTQR